MYTKVEQNKNKIRSNTYFKCVLRRPAFPLENPPLNKNEVFSIIEPLEFEITVKIRISYQLLNYLQ
jgi:hypothetical protein